MVNIVENMLSILDGSILHLASTHLLGDPGIPHISEQDKTGQIVPKYGS